MSPVCSIHRAALDNSAKRVSSVNRKESRHACVRFDGKSELFSKVGIWGNSTTECSQWTFTEICGLGANIYCIPLVCIALCVVPAMLEKSTNTPSINWGILLYLLCHRKNPECTITMIFIQGFVVTSRHEIHCILLNMLSSANLIFP